MPPPTVISRKVKPIKSFTNEELFKLQVHIQEEIERAWNKGENEGNTGSNEDVLKPLLLEIIKQALAWWATSFTIQSILGDGCVNKRKFPAWLGRA